MNLRQLLDEPLFPKILRYNAHPRVRAKELWPFPADACANLRAWLAQVPDSWRSDLSQEQQTQAVFFWDFAQEDSRKLALLDDRQLTLLAAVVGVTLYATSLAHIVERKARLECQEALGELFDYALERGQYYVGVASNILTRYDPELPLTVRCVVHGWLALYFCSLHWPAELSNPFQRRLAVLGGEYCANLKTKKTLRVKEWHILWRMLKKCLLREVVPTWRPYFNA